MRLFPDSRNGLDHDWRPLRTDGGHLAGQASTGGRLEEEPSRQVRLQEPLGVSLRPEVLSCATLTLGLSRQLMAGCQSQKCGPDAHVGQLHPQSHGRVVLMPVA